MKNYKIKNLLRPLNKTLISNFYRNNNILGNFNSKNDPNEVYPNAQKNLNKNFENLSEKETQHKFINKEILPDTSEDIYEAYKLNPTKSKSERNYKVSISTENLSDVLSDNRLDNNANLDAEKIDYPNMTKKELENEEESTSSEINKK